MKPSRLVTFVVLVVVLVASTAFAVAGYYGARDAVDQTHAERADRIVANCESVNETNRGIVKFIGATVSNSRPLVAPMTGNVDVDRAIVQILAQVNTNSATRNEAIAHAQDQYFPIHDCTTGKIVPASTTSSTPH